MTSRYLRLALPLLLASASAACGGDGSPSECGTDPSGGGPYTAFADAFPEAGNPAGTSAVPEEARAVDTSSPDRVIGDGSPASCTSQAVVDAIALGGVITFDCGAAPITITLTETAKIFNETGPEIVIDGGGLVTLSGGGSRRILYMNTCDEAQGWTTSHCNDQDHPQLTVQNITLVDGDATSEGEDQLGGGGAIFVRGGRFKVVNSRFFSNQCAPTGPDVGGAAIRVFDQHQDLPVYVVHSTFGGRGDLSNICSNGGALSSIGVSYTVLNSDLSFNEATGNGANPMEPGTPGGGSGGAIYNDGNTFTLSVCGTEIHDNVAVEGGSAIFFVSNDRSGHLLIQGSVLQDNSATEFSTPGYPSIFYLGSGDILEIDSTIE